LERTEKHPDDESGMVRRLDAERRQIALDLLRMLA